jgi:hypothetical protein
MTGDREHHFIDVPPERWFYGTVLFVLLWIAVGFLLGVW